MPKTKLVNEPQEVQKAHAEYLRLKNHARKQESMREAEETINQYESEYDHAKEVFFKVNGARRILKNRQD